MTMTVLATILIVIIITSAARYLYLLWRVTRMALLHSGPNDPCLPGHCWVWD